MPEWDRTHDWVLSRHYTERATLMVLFQGGRPSVSELATLRRCLPWLRHLAPVVLRDRIGQSGNLDLGEFDGREARRWQEDLKGAGLQVVIRDTSFTSYLPIDRTTGAALLVEDEEKARELVEEMMRAGVPVQDIEG